MVTDPGVRECVEVSTVSVDDEELVGIVVTSVDD